MELNEIKDNEGARKERTRVGRGIGSGKGKTAGRGHKGQKSRSGVAIKGFEGGQMPIYRRLPKRGFNNRNRVEFSTLNLGELQRHIDSGKLDASKPINAETLFEAGVCRENPNGVKLLAKGTLKAKVQLEVAKASDAAQKAVEAAGGKLSFPEAGPTAAEKAAAKKGKGVKNPGKAEKKAKNA